MVDISLHNDHIKRINENLKLAYGEEEQYWKQRSRQLWLSLRDQNTSYFHASTKAILARNKFSVIENEEGQLVFEEDKIVNVITSYF